MYLWKIVILSLPSNELQEHETEVLSHGNWVVLGLEGRLLLTLKVTVLYQGFLYNSHILGAMI